MKKQIQNTNFYIGSDLILTDKDNNPQQIENEKILIQLDNDKQPKLYSREFLYLSSLFEIPSFINIKYLKFVKQDKKNFHGLNEYRAVYTKPYYFDKSKEFRYIPGYPEIMISNSGIVKNIKTGSILPVDNAASYSAITTYCAFSSKRRRVKVHRLVAMAWVLDNQEDDKPIVNHINSDARNFNSYNLEWCSFKENSIHCSKSGNNPFSKPCIIRNIYTGEITEFPGIYEFVRASNYTESKSIYTGSTMLNRLVMNNTCEFRLKGDDRPWLYINKENRTKFINPGVLSNYIIYVDDGTNILVFNGSYGLKNYFKLSVELCDINSFITELKRLKPDYKINVVKQLDSTKIEMLDRSNGNVQVYDSVRELVRKVPILNKSSVLDCIKTNGSQVFKGFSFRYVSENEWPEPAENIYVSNKLKIVDKVANQEFICNSLREASRKLLMGRKKVKRIIDRPNDNDRFIIKVIGQL